ncbi:MAG: ATP-binding cassette domain-containing protein [Acidimicrobiia bacterium]
MIRTRGLTRHFQVKGDTVEAVRGIDLDVEQGELVAFLGPNGAGKSTTLRMLTTLLRPSAGTAQVVGHDVVAEPAAVRRRIGSIGQGNGAGQNQRVRDELVNQGRCYGLDRGEAGTRADELLGALDLVAMAGRIVNSLSGGQRRRLDIAMGMVHRPVLLFLDEPSTGLDPQNRANLTSLIEQLRVEHGTTIVLTTHYLDEADALADRVVVVVDGGRVIADGSPQQLKADLVGDTVVVTAASHRDAAAVARAIERVAGPQALVVAGATVTARARGAAAVLPRLLRSLGDAGIEVAEAEVARATLDDVFLVLTGRSLRESAVAADPAVASARTFEEQAA